MEKRAKATSTNGGFEPFKGIRAAARTAFLACPWLAVAAFLAACTVWGFPRWHAGDHPIPVRVARSESMELLSLLQEKDIRSAEYDEVRMVITVAQDEVDQAAMVLARKETEHRTAAIASLVGEMDGVEKARVFFADTGRRSLFGVGRRATASAVIRLRDGCTMNRELAASIATLIASARQGMRAKDVLISDGYGIVAGFPVDVPGMQSHRE